MMLGRRCAGVGIELTIWQYCSIALNHLAIRLVVFYRKWIYCIFFCHTISFITLVVLIISVFQYFYL